jgi:hypothetical protein
MKLTEFTCYYLYGLTDNPFRQSSDIEAFKALYKLVIGEQGGLLIGSSFHPYQLITPKGTTVWQAAYVQTQLDGEAGAVMDSIIPKNRQLLVDPSPAFKSLNIWPDSRLSFEENPVFSKYVPFIVPFLVHKTSEPIQWDLQIEKAMKAHGNPGDYVNSVTEALRFLMPSPSFVLGFDEFNEENPSKLIEHFIRFLPRLQG